MIMHGGTTRLDERVFEEYASKPVIRIPLGQLARINAGQIF